MAQKFLTYEEQLLKLQNEKSLTISDFSAAQKTLEEISYYSLIVGYKSLFLHPASKKYKYGVTFEEITAFYHFDEQLRSLFLKYILQVERHLKSIVSYHFCEKYGEQQTAYLNPQNFNYDKHEKQVLYLTKTLKRTITTPGNYKYITHHANKYHNVPLWVAVNAMTMGQISAFYQYMSNDLQTKICKSFPVHSEKQLHQFVTVIAKYRNICAHGERLYNFRTTDMIPDTLLHAKLAVEQKKGAYAYGKNDLFAVVISLYYLIRNEEFKLLNEALSDLITWVITACPHLTSSYLLKEMGFPHNWNKTVQYMRKSN